MIVADTSALVEYLAGADEAADRVRSLFHGEVVATPHAVDLECASTLRGLVRGGKLPDQEGRRALDLLARMNLRRYDHVRLLPRVWELRHNMWPYDAAFAALAEALVVPLVTVDRKYSKTPGLRCVIRDLRDT